MNIANPVISLSCRGHAEIPIPVSFEDDSEHAARWSAYIKERPSSSVMANFEVAVKNGKVALVMQAGKTNKLPVGQFLYFIEAAVGPKKFQAQGYVNVQL